MSDGIWDERLRTRHFFALQCHIDQALEPGPHTVVNHVDGISPQVEIFSIVEQPLVGFGVESGEVCQPSTGASDCQWAPVMARANVADAAC